jgi:hypothetical protein
MTKTVADQFAEALVVAGVKRIYGIVGDSLNGLTDSLRRQGMIEWVHVRHEEVAAFAAGAEAHLTGDLAVCVRVRDLHDRALVHRPPRRALRSPVSDSDITSENSTKEGLRPGVHLTRRTAATTPRAACALFRY